MISVGQRLRGAPQEVREVTLKPTRLSQCILYIIIHIHTSQHKLYVSFSSNKDHVFMIYLILKLQLDLSVSTIECFLCASWQSQLSV